jgi:hypothetical protein
MLVMKPGFLFLIFCISKITIIFQIPFFDALRFFAIGGNVDNMKRLGFRSAFLSTEEKVGAGTNCPQTTEPQLFYIVC